VKVLDDGCVCTGCKFADYKKCEVFRVVTAVQHIFQLLIPERSPRAHKGTTIRLEIDKCQRKIEDVGG